MEKLNEDALSMYERIAFMGGKESIELVRNIKTDMLYVKKTLLQYDISVYEALRQRQIKGIPQIFDLIQKEDRLIVIEEYIEGQNLYDYLQNKLFQPEEALVVFKQLEKILSRLHSLSPAIIHRDIKPSNVLMTTGGQVYLIDFNAARHFNSDKSNDTVILGTNGYASPEQYGFAQTDPRSDVYSLAVLFCVMISGKYPNEGIECPKKLKKVLQKAMDLSPEMRYKDVRSFITALSTAITGGILGKIPGFRQGKTSHKIGAIVIYLCILLSVPDFHTVPDNAMKIIAAKALYVIMCLLSFGVCVDFCGIRRLFPGTYHRQKIYRYIIIYLYICFIISAFIAAIIGLVGFQ